MVSIIEKNKLSVLVFGAGAIGSYIGGSLALQGHQVVFIERPAMVSQLREIGIRIRVGENLKYLRSPMVFGELEEVLNEYNFDVGILAVKSYDTDSVLAAWQGVEEKLPPILCLQNGVENEGKIANLLDGSRVISGTVTTAVGKPGPGEITVEKLRGVGVAGASDLALNLVAAMNEAGLKAKSIESAAGMKWSKMITNLLANASSAILQESPAVIFNDRRLYEIEVKQIREALAVMRVYGIPVVDLPGTPVRALTWVMKNLPVELSRLILKGQMIKGRGDKMPSFYIDLISGRGKSEVDYLNGAVARFSEERNLNTPVNKKLNKILTMIVSGAIDQRVYKGNLELFKSEIL